MSFVKISRVFTFVFCLSWVALYTIVIGVKEAGWKIDLIIKPIPVVIYATYIILHLVRSGKSHTPLLVLLALTLQIAADEFLALDEEWEPAFIIGLAFFLVGHIVNALAFSFSPKKGIPIPKLHPCRLLPFIVVGIAAFVVIAFVGDSLSTVEWIAIPVYILAIATAGWRASARIGYTHDTRFSQRVRLLGYLLYISSDIILAVDKFSVKIECKWLRTLLVFSTYYTANALITISFPNQSVVAATPQNVQIELPSAPYPTPVHAYPVYLEGASSLKEMF
eukprot:TRINITY_DN96791_c0_g1_i1.p1 TRINITY_DN96791_c0_g1~~TRINITY_DN96791_c0_g1_i1.p1  ORF type:complete len:279 (+),score=34.35 TRINITY_DN96791_c0_g1_i1:82-918(+)